MSEIRHITDDGVRAETIPADTHPTEYVFKTCHVVVSEFGDIDLMGMVTDDRMPGWGLTPPKFSRMVKTVIQNGALPFSLRGLDDREGADEEGSAAVTAIHVNREFSLKRTMTHIVESGQFDGCVNMMREIREETDPSAELLAAYALATYAKGWLAEMFVTTHKDFGKLWVSNDEAGYDIRFRPQDRMEDGQLKPMTLIGSNSQAEFEEKNIPHWFYQWTRDGIMFSRAERANEMNSEAAKHDGMRSATILKKSAKVAEIKEEMGRSARALWWPPEEER